MKKDNFKNTIDIFVDILIQTEIYKKSEKGIKDKLLLDEYIKKNSTIDNQKPQGE